MMSTYWEKTYMLKQTIQKLHLWLLKRLFCKLTPTKSSIRPHLANRMHGKITTRKNKTLTMSWSSIIWERRRNCGKAKGKVFVSTPCRHTGTWRMWALSFTPQLFYPREITLVPTSLEAGWVPQPVWEFWRRGTLAITGIRIPNQPARSPDAITDYATLGPIKKLWTD